MDIFRTIFLCLLLSSANVVYAADFMLTVSLHPESGEPILRWKCTDSSIASFDVYRSKNSDLQLTNKHLLVRGLGKTECTFFDMRTEPGVKYSYRVAAENSQGKTVCVSNEFSILSRRRAFTIEGYMPIALGWSYGDEFARSLHVNLILQRPWVRPMSDGKRIYRVTGFFYAAVSKKWTAMKDKSKAERIRATVLDPWHVAWQIHDEKWDPKEEFKKVEQIRQYDHCTPTMGNVMAMQARGGMAGINEIFSVEHYSDKANWPTIIVPEAKRAMQKYGKDWPLLHMPHPLWMCFDVFSTSAARRPAAFTKASVYCALGYGVKGLYFFNDPGSTGFSGGPGIRLMPKQQEMVRIIDAEMQAWGHYLLYSRFECEGITHTPRQSQPMSNNPWYKKLVHPVFKDYLHKRWPLVQAVVQKHPRGRFLFVIPNMEIDYWVDDVRVIVPRKISGNVRAYRLTSGMPEVPIEPKQNTFSVDCGSVYAAAVYLITDDVDFVNKIRRNINRYATEIDTSLLKLTKMDLKDTGTFLKLCPDSDKKQDFLTNLHNVQTRVASGKIYESQRQSERLFRTILKAGLRNKPPYRVKPSSIRRAELIKQTTLPPGVDLALSSRGAKAYATFTEWIFPRLAKQRNSPFLAIDGKRVPTPADRKLWRGANTAWVTRHTSVEPYPVLTIELPKAETIGEIWLKQYHDNPNDPVEIKWLAVEFVEDGSVEFFTLPMTEKVVRLTFPARQTQTIRFVPLRYNKKVPLFGFCEVEVYAADKVVKDFHRIPITRNNQEVDLSTFGW